MQYFNSIEECVENWKSSFRMFIKFGSKSNLEKLQKGLVYMKSLKFFNELETGEGSGKPDRYDGKWPIENVRVSFIEEETGKEFMTTGNAVMSFGYENHPIFCMFCLDKRNSGDAIYNEEEQTITVPISFTDVQRSKMKDGLGEYALMITNTSEFLSRIDAGLKNAGIEYRIGDVKYNQSQSEERVKAILENLQNIAFNKDADEFSYQQETRILVTNHEIDKEDHLEVNIGDLSDISKLILTEEFMNDFTIYYETKCVPSPQIITI